MEKKEKLQKPLYKKWWFWLIVLCVLGAAGNGLSGGKSSDPADDTPSSSVSSSRSEDTPSSSSASSPSENPPEDSSTPSAPTESTPEISEEDKETAKIVDSEILVICTAAEQQYNAFQSLLSVEGTSDLDAYNAAKSLKDTLTDYNYRQLSDIKGNGTEEFDDYKEKASLYIFVMSEVADAAMAYLDDSKTSNLSAYQEAAEKVSTYSYPLVASRLTFLSASGFSDEEISALVDASASE